MKRLRIIGLSLLALFAFGAVMASSASAVEGILPLTVKTFSVEGTNPILQNTAGEEINCKKVKSINGKAENDVHGTVDLDFEGCKSSIAGVNSLGDAKEVILAKVLILVCLIDSAKLLFGIAIETDEPVHLEIPLVGKLIFVEGRVIGHVLTTGKVEKFEVDLAGAKGAGNVAECKDEAGGVKKHTLVSKIDAEPAVPASEKVEKGLVKFGEKVEFMDK